MHRSSVHQCRIIASVSLFLFFTCSFNWNVAMAFQPPLAQCLSKNVGNSIFDCLPEKKLTKVKYYNVNRNKITIILIKWRSSTNYGVKIVA
jgi:hypothetical protein